MDEYRVSLFKKKIRSILPDFKGLRFGRSKGQCHLIISVAWQYGTENSEKYGLEIMTRLKANNIQSHEQRDIFRLSEYFGGPRKLDCIAIPIDQESLPERKRK